MNDFPSSLDVYDIKQFHMLENNGVGEHMFVAEHTLKLSDPTPDYVAIYEKGEFTVVKLARLDKLLYTDDYLSPHTPFVFQLTPCYTPENTRIDVYPSTFVLEGTDLPKELRSIASLYRPTFAPVHYTVDNLSPAYARALIDHHLAVAPDNPRFTRYQNCAPIEWSAE